MMKSVINPEYLTDQKIAEVKERFNAARPCRFVVLENFFTDEIANQLYENFPSIEKLNVKRKSINENKAEDYHFDRFHPSFSDIHDAVNEQSFYDFLSKISEIDGIHSVKHDPLGSGVHQGQNGSFVDVHIDTNMLPRYNLQRRLNLLVYLNKNWREEYGGNLEIWDQKMTKCEHSVSPTFNRAIIFESDERSPHGYSKINVPEGETRKSFYTYYYTKPEVGFKYRDSKFISRPDEGTIKKVATGAKETLKHTVKGFLQKIGVKSLDFQDKNKDK